MSDNDSEPDWGNPKARQSRRDFSTSERSVAMIWLSIAALVSLIIEVVYLGQRITIDSHSYPFPWTILLATIFNYILCRTARLWSGKGSNSGSGLASIPLVVWFVGCVIILIWPILPWGHGDVWLAGEIRPLLLVLAGTLGGLYAVYGRSSEK